MPNHVINTIWLVKPGGDLTSEEIKNFFSEFMKPVPEKNNEMCFDFNVIIPQPDNIWQGSIRGGDDNIRKINERGGLEYCRKVMAEGGKFDPDNDGYEWQPCLNDKEIEDFGLISWFDWNRENWGTKWGAYECAFNFEDIHSPHVHFWTAWSPPYPILRKLREKALKEGYEINAEFGGEIDHPGEYSEGLFMHFEATYDEETGDQEITGDPVEVFS